MLSSNHPSKKTPIERKLIIWVFHDARPGHLSQLEGLVNRLSFHQDCSIRWFNISKHKLTIQNFFYLPKFLKPLTTPDLILGAGHSTHLSVLIAGIKFKAFTTLIMKPSLPSFFFDAVICPKHDGLVDSNKILSTLGALNKIIPASACTNPPKRNKHLMLIGGPSKHFIFDEAKLLKSIQEICQDDTSKAWHLSDSPRTPISFLPALKRLCLSNLKVYSHADDSFGKLHEMLIQSHFTWVTPDSMSMLYESLTAGSRTAVFDIPLSKEHKPSRIAKQVQELISTKTVISFKSWQMSNAHKNSIKQTQATSTLWEAERAALWLLKRIKENGKQ